jgi:hypothetical protein
MNRAINLCFHRIMSLYYFFDELMSVLQDQQVMIERLTEPIDALEERVRQQEHQIRDIQGRGENQTEGECTTVFLFSSENMKMNSHTLEMFSFLERTCSTTYVVVTTNGVAFVFAIRHDVYSTTHFSKCISYLLHTMFYTRADQAYKGNTREWSTHTRHKGNNEQRKTPPSLFLPATNPNGWRTLSYLRPIILVGTRTRYSTKKCADYQTYWSTFK